jgi:hypothetical protein
MRISRLIFATLWFSLLASCGGSEEKTTRTIEVPDKQSPVVKWVLNDIDITSVGENQTLTIPYNIVDPDSTNFNVKANLTTQTETVVFVDENNSEVTFTSPYIQGDTPDTLTISVVDESNLSSSDSVEITFKETINAAPTLDITFERSVFPEQDTITLLYALHANDEDSDNSELVITQDFYTEDPSVCLPVCLPVSYTVVEYQGRYAATLDLELTQENTEIWLKATAEDFKELTEDISSTLVRKKDDFGPQIIIEEEREVVPYEENMEFAFTQYVDDADTASSNISVTQSIFDEDPIDCRPSCKPISATWESYEDRHVGYFSYPNASDVAPTPLWLSVKANDGEFETEELLQFHVSRLPNKPPTITLALETTEIKESEGLILPYTMIVDDVDNSQEEIEISQTIFLDNPATCRPICDPVSATWRQFNNRYAAYVNVVLEHDERLWLLVSADDGEYQVEKAAEFNARKSINTPPRISLVLDTDSIKNDDGQVTVRYNMQITDDEANSELTVTQTLYDEDPTFCLPLCNAISADYSQEDERNAITFSYSFEQPRTTFYLLVEVSDADNTASELMSFSVSQIPNTPPNIDITLDSDTIGEGEPLRYLMLISDVDGDELTSNQLIFDDNPETCRPVCQPLSVAFSNEAEQYAAFIDYIYIEPTTPLYLYTEASDGAEETIAITSFQVVRDENTAPEIDIFLEKNTIIEGDFLNYVIEMEDPDGDELSLEQEVFDANPSTCRPVCTPISTEFRNFEGQRALRVNQDITEESKQYYLSVSVSDEIDTSRSFAPFVVSNSNDSPTLSVSLSANEFDENEPVVYRIDASDNNNDDISIESNIYTSNPEQCLPNCSPVPGTLSVSGNTYSFTAEWEITQPTTPAWLRVSVSDGETETTEVLPFVVNEVTNTPPEVSITLEQDSVNEGEFLRYIIEAEDPDGNDINIEQLVFDDNPATCRPVCIPINTEFRDFEEQRALLVNQDISTPSKLYYLSVAATDGISTTRAYASFTVMNVNDAPSLNVTLDSSELNENEAITYQVEYFDNDGDEVTIDSNIYVSNPETCLPDCTPVPGTLDINGSNYTFTANWTITQPVTSAWLRVIASDGESRTIRTLTFVVNEVVNEPPQLTVTLASNSIMADEAMQYQVQTSDEEGDNITVTSEFYLQDPESCRPSCQPDEAIINGSNGNYTLTPDIGYVSSVTAAWLLVKATDGTSTTESINAFTITPNLPPQVTLTLDATRFTEREAITYTLVISDPEGDTLTAVSNLYLQNPSQCRPDCGPATARVDNSGERYTITPGFVVSQEETDVWLLIDVTDSNGNVTTVMQAFIIERIPDVDINFQSNVINGGQPARLRFSLALRDNNATPNQTQFEVYFSDPRERPTNPIATQTTGSFPSYEMIFYENYSEPTTTAWLEAEVTVNGQRYTVVKSFLIRRI